MKNVLNLILLLLILFSVSGCSDDEKDEEIVSNLEINIYRDANAAISSEDDDYAYWGESPFDKTKEVIFINLQSKSAFGILHNLPSSINIWAAHNPILAVMISGTIKESDYAYTAIPETKSINFYISDIVNLSIAH